MPADSEMSDVDFDFGDMSEVADLMQNDINGTQCIILYAEDIHYIPVG